MLVHHRSAFRELQQPSSDYCNGAPWVGLRQVLLQQQWAAYFAKQRGLPAAQTFSSDCFCSSLGLRAIDCRHTQQAPNAVPNGAYGAPSTGRPAAPAPPPQPPPAATPPSTTVPAVPEPASPKRRSRCHLRVLQDKNSDNMTCICSDLIAGHCAHLLRLQRAARNCYCHEFTEVAAAAAWKQNRWQWRHGVQFI